MTSVSDKVHDASYDACKRGRLEETQAFVGVKPKVLGNVDKSPMRGVAYSLSLSLHVSHTHSLILSLHVESNYRFIAWVKKSSRAGKEQKVLRRP